MGAAQSHLGYHRRREVLRRPPPMTSKSNAGNLDPLLTRVIAGNFRVEKLLGSGAMGNVYKAEQLSLSKAVAIKVLHPHLMSDDKLVLRFKREAKSASLLNHPNSIQIIDSGQDKDGTLYIAMELLTGRDLAQVIRDDFPIPVPRIVRIMSQVLSALDEAHIQGVIHRDLKPSNIMLIERRGEADFVKVCDFGIAKAAQDAKEDRESMLTIQGLVCGTPEYMAPEQARGETLDGRADLYAAAVILFQMVTGDIPFKGDTPMAIVSRHLVETPAVPSRRRTDVPISPALDALILKGMEKNRELRFPDATAFREALEAIGTADARPSSAPDLRAQMATTQVSSSGAGLTAVVASSDPANHFGATTRLPRRSRRRPILLLVAGLAAAAGALYLRMPRVDVDPGLPGIAGTATTQLGQGTGPGVEPASQPAPASPAAAAVPTVAPARDVAVAPAAQSAPSTPEAPAGEGLGRAASPAVHALSAKLPAHRHKGPVATTTSAAEPTLEPAVAKAGPGLAATAAPGTPASALVPSPSEPSPVQRGAREVLSEGEKLLGQGEVRDACVRGEEAKRMNPKMAPIYKFLGKCYMRAGNTAQANDNYRKYLDLSPNASDAMFIKSIIK